jgi:hypothetical protein
MGGRKMPDDGYPKGYLEMLKTLTEEIKRKYQFKKSDVYPENAPAWLADEFNIKWIKYTKLLEKEVKFLGPYEEFVTTPLLYDPDKVYDICIMWIGGEGIDIRLF